MSKNLRRKWDAEKIADYRVNANYWNSQFGSASILGGQMNDALDRIESLEKWMKDEGYQVCDYCYELVPTTENGSLRICKECSEQ